MHVAPGIARRPGEVHALAAVRVRQVQLQGQQQDMVSTENTAHGVAICRESSRSSRRHLVPAPTCSGAFSATRFAMRGSLRSRSGDGAPSAFSFWPPSHALQAQHAVFMFGMSSRACESEHLVRLHGMNVSQVGQPTSGMPNYAKLRACQRRSDANRRAEAYEGKAPVLPGYSSLAVRTPAAAKSSWATAATASSSRAGRMAQQFMAAGCSCAPGGSNCGSHKFSVT